MDFKLATNQLLAPISHKDLASALGVSIPAIRQARLSKDAMAYRNAPQNWQTAVIKLAENKIVKLNQLIKRLKSQN